MYNSDVDSWRGFQPFFFSFLLWFKYPNAFAQMSSEFEQMFMFKTWTSSSLRATFEQSNEMKLDRNVKFESTTIAIHTNIFIARCFTLGRLACEYFSCDGATTNTHNFLTSQFQMAAFFNYRNIHRNKEDSLKLWLKPLKALFKPINWFYFTFCRKLLNSVCKTNLDQNTISFRINHEVRNGKQFSMSRLDIVTKVTRMCEVEIFWFYSHDME